MKTTDLFKSNRSSKKINESIEKVFGTKLNLESFDTTKLEDARNKIRTQISQVRSESGFNETIENESLTKAQWMLDAINAEIGERAEHIVGTVEEEGADNDAEIMKLFKSFDEQANEIGAYGDPDVKKAMALVQAGKIEDAAAEIADAYSDQDGGEVYDINDMYTDLVQDLLYVTGAAGTPEQEGMEMEVAPPGAKAERMVKHIKKGYADDGKLTDKEKSIAYATAWKQHNKDKNEDMNTNEAYIDNAKDAINLLASIRKQSKIAELGQGEPVRPNQLVNDLWDVMQWIENNMKESIETESVKTGEDMTRLQEGEIQQASAIVTAKTMVDRVGRWIEELSGMENDTLLQLGDSIRDEMGQEQAKAFISTVAPAIQSALENLKSARETLSGGVRALTGEEQPAEMLGGDMGADMGAGTTDSGDELGGEAGPDTMNDAGDEFAAAEPAAGGLEASGREQRESIQYSNRLLKVLAG